MRRPNTSALRRRIAQFWPGFVAVLAVAGSGCTNSTAPVLDGMVGARAAALICLDNGKLTSGAECPTDAKARALVGGGSRGTLGLALPSVPTWADQDKAVPGMSPLSIAGLPVALAVDVTGQQALVATIDGAHRRIVRIDLAKVPSDRMALSVQAELGYVPADVAIVQRNGASWLAVADPAGGAIHLTPTDGFGATPSWTTWIVGGSPSSLAVLPQRQQLWIGHLRHGYATVVQFDRAGPVEWHDVAIEVGCGDGLDGDGDGLIDRLDPGCDGPLDDDERDPELAKDCSNGVDDDGDGATDGKDSDCNALPLIKGFAVANGCRDGLDNDGDGQTDFPSDPGCADFADASEASDAPGCANGVDDDGDGQTDGADAQCAQGLSREWVADPSVASLAGAPTPACDNGVDDDGDGTTDLQDPDCGRRSDSAEAGPDSAPAVRIAATSDEKWLAVAHQGRREVLFIDVGARKLLRPSLGTSAPYQRSSQLDARDHVLGLAFGGRPTALTAVTYDGKPAMAIATSPGGLVIAQLDGPDAATPSIRLLATSATAASISRPVLWVAGSAVDLGATIPVRYASLGPLRVETTANGVRANGIELTKDAFEHRAEQWRLTYQGLLPGGERSTGRWIGPGVLHDPGADFCQVGVIPGDFVILPATPACPGGSAKTVRAPVLEVFGDTLILDTAAATEDLVITKANQAAYDLAENPSPAVAQALPPPQCFADGAVHYELRSPQWLLTGSRTGLLSRRPSRDGVCAPLSSELIQAARMNEPALRQVNGQIQRPASCPYNADGLDAAFVANPLTTPVFSALQMRPGCANRAVGGTPAVQVLPSLREAAWTWSIAPGYTPRISAIGAAPTALLGGAKLKRVLAADAGRGALVVVDIASGTVVSTLD